MAINREKVLEAAQKLADKKKYDKAVIELRRLIDADPNDVRTLQRIGDLQLKQALYAEAIDTFESLGKHYANDGFALKAIAVYKHLREIIAAHAPQLEERYGHIAPRLADLYHQLGLTSDALVLLEEIATRLQHQQKESEAALVLEKIAQLDPTNPLQQLRLAEALSRARDLDGAVASFRSAALLLMQTDRRDDALHVLERLLQHRPDPEQARACAQLYLSRNRPHDVTHALTKLQICFQADPRDLDALSLIARAFEMIGQSVKAIEVQKQMAGIARETGRADVFREIVTYLVRVAPHDPAVRQLAQELG